MSSELNVTGEVPAIAIVGVACRLPGARDADEFWSLLAEGREARTVLTDEALRSAGVPEALLGNPQYVKAGMFLPQMELFDPAFFGFSPLDGRILDPQHRHFLECSWEALENAGYDPSRYSGSIGVFGGSGHNAYLASNLLTNPELVAEVGFFLLRHTGNDKDFLATRVSYCLDLKGPSVNIQTACSTSLVAVHTAAQSLLNGECDMAIAGGVTIELPHRQGYLYKDSEILSRDGHCRPFDASAGGTVFGSGVGVVVLKRLDAAIEDGDHIHAIIRSSAVNNDGAGKISYLAPSVEGQAAAIQEALSIAEIDPGSVTYIEAHGTGTPMGDPIEVAALTQAYASGNDRRQYCALGSVKSNIGHLDTAAGAASLIKVVLAMQHRQLPATLHYSAPNPAIDFAATPFFVNAQLRAWDSPAPLRAGVSSLGVGGTNAHVIVEEAPWQEPAASARRRQLLLFSARTDGALARARDRFARFFGERAHEASAGWLADAAYTLAIGRRAFSRRGFVVAESAADAAVALEPGTNGRFIEGEAPAAARRVAFMFAGGGAQFPTMGAGLYREEPVFRAAVDECLALLKGLVDYDLAPLLYPASDADVAAAGRALERPSRTLPALFVTQYAQARLWQSWGVEPAALIGHSMGENTAACLAGVMSLQDALGLVVLRGRLFETVGEGGMLSVELAEQDLLPHLSPELSVAAINAPGLVVASGPMPAIQALERRLAAAKIGCQRIRIDVAAHSSMLDPILAAFGRYLESIELRAPRIPMVSNLTGDWLKASEATDPGYWVQHLRSTVRFAEGVGRLLAAGEYALLEVGPGRTLASLASLHDAKRPDQSIVTSMRHPDDATDDALHMLTAFGRLWVGGALVDAARLHGEERRRRMPLPTYAFDHVPCWTAPGKGATSVAGLSRDDAEKCEGPAGWFYEPVWRRAGLPGLDAPMPMPVPVPVLTPTPMLMPTSTPLPTAVPVLTPAVASKEPAVAAAAADLRVLVLAPPDSALGDAFIAGLRAAGVDLRVPRESDRLSMPESGDCEIRIDVADDYVGVVAKLQRSGWTPSHVLHLLSLAVPADAAAMLQPLQRRRVFDSIFHLAQAAAGEGWDELAWCMVTPGALQVAGEAVHSPLPALAIGPARVLPREFPGWRCRVVDIDLDADVAASLPARLLGELRALASPAGSRPAGAASDEVVALRGNARFVQTFEAVGERWTGQSLRLRADAVYLVTGGTGGLGLVAAEALCSVAPVTLVLAVRRPLPPREYWPRLIADAAPEAPTLATLSRLEQRGARIVLEQVDVADAASVAALASSIGSLGPLRGIVHTAGVVDDALLLNKDIEQAAAVLAPKWLGTVLLGQVFGGSPLDFFVLYSSSSALTGLPGQIDYAAANAFQDAFAHWRSAQGLPCRSINWPAWRAVGMAADVAAGSSGARRLPAGRPVEHPLLHRCVTGNGASPEYVTSFAVAEQWVLAEHRIKDGPALLPGSGFIELARAAWQDGRPTAGAVEIAQASFEQPFIVGDLEHKLMHIRLTDAADGSRFELASDSAGDEVVHASGEIRASTPLAQRIDLDAIRRRCQAGTQAFDDPDHHPHLEFGTRWAALKSVSLGDREALIELDFAGHDAAELQAFALHPALLDMATAGAQAIIGVPAGEAFHVPVGYGRLRFTGRFPVRSYSHVVVAPPSGATHDADLVRFEIAVCDPEGRVFLEVKDFTMRRLPDAEAFRRGVAPAVGAGAGAGAGTGAEAPTLARSMELGISPEEGSRALLALLGGNAGPQVAVSPYRLAYVAQELRRIAAPEAPAGVAAYDPDADARIPEIEAVLAGLESIARVVVRCFVDAAGESRFVAFFSPNSAHYATTSELRKEARALLEPALQPQQFVELDEFPLQAVGEVDRKALRDPLAPEDRHVAPRTATEKAVARIWSEVLGIPRVGLRDNFFDLGGHSLLAIRVIVRISKKLGARLDQATMVLNTLEQIAREIEQRTGAGAPLGFAAEVSETKVAGMATAAARMTAAAAATAATSAASTAASTAAATAAAAAAPATMTTVTKAAAAATDAAAAGAGATAAASTTEAATTAPGGRGPGFLRGLFGGRK